MTKRSQIHVYIKLSKLWNKIDNKISMFDPRCVYATKGRMTHATLASWLPHQLSPRTSASRRFPVSMAVSISTSEDTAALNGTCRLPMRVPLTPPLSREDLLLRGVLGLLKRPANFFMNLGHQLPLHEDEIVDESSVIQPTVVEWERNRERT